MVLYIDPFNFSAFLLLIFGMGTGYGWMMRDLGPWLGLRRRSSREHPPEKPEQLADLVTIARAKPEGYGRPPIYGLPDITKKGDD